MYHSHIALVLFSLLVGCTNQEPVVNDDSDYRKEYLEWRTSVQKELDQKMSWVSGDSLLLKNLADKTSSEHLEFLESELKGDPFCTIVLDHSRFFREVENKLMDVQSVQNRRNIWADWLATKEKNEDTTH